MTSSNTLKKAQNDAGMAYSHLNPFPKENLTFQGPIVLNRWEKKAHEQPHRLMHHEIYELLAKIVTPLEHTLAESLIHYHLQFEPMGLTNGLDDELRFANALKQLADITEYRLLGKSENLESGMTLTELANRAYDHYFAKSEFISAFCRRATKLRQQMIPPRSQPLRPYDRAITNVLLSRLLMNQD